MTVKISDMTDAVSVDSQDHIELSQSGPITRRTTLQLALEAAHPTGGIAHAYNATPTTQGSVNATPAKVTIFDTDSSNNQGTTPDHTNDKITIDRALEAKVSFECSFGGTLNSTFVFRIYVNGSPVEGAAHRKIGTGGDAGVLSFTSFEVLSLSAADEVEAYVSSPDGGTTINVYYAGLYLL